MSYFVSLTWYSGVLRVFPKLEPHVRTGIRHQLHLGDICNVMCVWSRSLIKNILEKISPVFCLSVWDVPLLAYQTNQYLLSSGGRLQQEGFTIKRYICALQLLELLLLVPLPLLVKVLPPPEHFLNLTFNSHCGFCTLTRKLWTFRATMMLSM